MKEEIDEIDFLYVDKHQTLVQVDTVNFVDIVIYAQSTKKKEFANTLKYYNKISSVDSPVSGAI